VKSLKRQAISGIKWSATSNATLGLFNLIKVSVLTRFLEKSDFGLMALVTFVLGFMNLFMDMGLSSAILHKQDITREEYASIYWLNILISLFLFVLIFIFSPLVASFYKEPQLLVLIPLMSLGIIFSALGRQFKTIEQKELNFRYIAITDVIGAVSGLILGIVLAVLDYGVFSLVFGALVRFAVSNMILFIRGIHIRGLLFHFEFKETKPFIRVGIYQVGGQVINYFNRDLDILLIGKLLGSDILGGYSLAKDLVRRPMGIINPIYTRVAMSIFPKFKNDHSSLRRFFTDLFYGMGAINAFIYGSIAIFAPIIVLILYGSDYLSITVYVQLFSFLIYLRSMGTNVGILGITTGRTDYEFYWNIFITLLMPFAIITGAKQSVSMIIILMGLVQLGLLVPCWYLFFNKQINLQFSIYSLSHLIPLGLASMVFSLAKMAYKNHVFWLILMELLLIIILGIYSYYSLKMIKDYVDAICKKWIKA